jgi:hypothetical protein
MEQGALEEEAIVRPTLLWTRVCLHPTKTVSETHQLCKTETLIFETLRKAVPVTSLFLSYMEPLSPVSRGKIGKADSGKRDYRASIMAPATPFCFWTTQKHLTVERTMGSRT